MPPLNYAFYTENFEIYRFFFKTYGHGVWYDETKETYDAAIDRAKVIIYQKVQADNPHLIFFGGAPVRTETTTDFHENTIADIDKQVPVQVTKTSRDKQIEGMIKGINSCASRASLETFHFFLKTFPETQEAYDNKLKSFA